MIEHLLDNYEFNLSSYIDAQSQFINDGIYFRIEYKRKIRNFNLDICAKIFQQNFIVVNDNNYASLVESGHLFNKKERGYRNNPLVIDGTSLVQFYLMDRLEKPTINELLLEESPNQTGSVLKRGPFGMNSFTSYLGKPEIVKKLNEQGYFYIYVTNLKQPDLPADFTFLMNQVEKDLRNFSLQQLNRSIERAEGFRDHPRAKKLALEISKVKKMQQAPYFGFKEAIEYREFIANVTSSLSDFALKRFQIPLNLKNILVACRRVSKEALSLVPDGRMRSYYMVTTGNNCSLSKIRNKPVKKS